MRSAAIGVAVLAAVLLAPLSARGARPDTVFFEDLTFDEIRDVIAAGSRSVIIAVGGVEDDGPQLVAGAPTAIVTYAADRIARAVGGTLVAPVIAYAPDGVVAAGGQGYSQLLEAAVTSAKASGFTSIFLLGESASSQAVLKQTAEKLDAAWRGEGTRVVHVADYHVKSGGEQSKYAADTIRFSLADVSQRQRFVRTSEVLAINGQRVRLEGLERADAIAAPQHGLALLSIKVDAAVAQIRGVLGRTGVQPVPAADTSRPIVLPTPNPYAPTRSSRFLEDLTATEIRQAVTAGNTIAIVPTGGTERNGFHMAVGKHNFHARAGADVMATKLGNALVAPVLQYVPQGQASTANPGVLSCARDCFEPLVATIARSLKALGFKEILLVGDNGGNQTPLNNVATLLNKEWDGTGVTAFTLSDFYEKGHEYQDAWFLGQFGWDESVVGSHAGIKDTSQLLYVKPESVRLDRIADSFANKRESGVSGDPTKATVEFGRVAIEFKANAAIAQFRALKARQAADSAGDSRPARRGGR